MSYKIEYWDRFDADEWEVETKGYAQLVVVVDDVGVEFSFYDPVRLSQTVNDDVSRSGLFIETEIIVIPCVNRVNIESALETLYSTGALKRIAMRGRI